jgi:hypothetical protein
VFVIGMHRSGTSAVTGMLAHLGVDTPAGDDLVPGTSTNERGHFESKTLIRIDNQLLRVLGGSWSAPPDLKPGWELGSEVVSLRDPAARAFHATFPARPVVWKDPRNCIVLPFWRSLLAPPIAAVLVYRDGLEVAQSLRTRSQLSLTHGLALWERYVRTSCADLGGVPTFVTEYGAMLDDPASSCRELVRFLTDVGIDVDPSRIVTAVDALDVDLRHAAIPHDEPAGISDSGREVLRALRACDGVHHPWRPPDLGDEPEWVDDFLTLRRRYEVLRRQIRSSRAMRVVEAWWKMRGVARPALDDQSLTLGDTD